MTYDAITAGAGHNGLVTAAYLAAGPKTLVLNDVTQLVVERSPTSFIQALNARH